MVLPTATPLYADLIDTTLVTVTDSTNSSPYTLNFNLSSVNISDASSNTMALSLHSINFSDSDGVANLNSNSLNLTSNGNNVSLSVDSSKVVLETPNELNVSSSQINVSSKLYLNLNGDVQPTDGHSVLVAGANGAQWMTTTTFFTTIANIETGVYENTGHTTSANISFQATYTPSSPPVVILTSNSNGNGEIVPVSVDGYTTDGSGNYTNFSVIFGSSRLNKLNYIVIPTSSSNVSVIPIV